MRIKSLGLVLSSLAVVAVLTGCDPAKEEPTGTTGTAVAADNAEAGAESAAPPSAPGAPPGADTLSDVKACGELAASLRANQKLIDEAEKIGPPAGHFAAGAAYIAAASEINGKAGSAGADVQAAADKVHDEMLAVDEAWQKTPDKKPSKTALNAAIADLKKVCSTK